MPLLEGTRLGAYEIIALLGAGGMGEVYRARDTRLNRSVAIKIVSDQWRERPDLRARFKIEAEAIAALSHPHICQLYDVGQHGDLDFLVMELVDGQSLADRLARGRLTIAQALEHAKAIAEAIGHAHRRGITHRDIKPANVILTGEGLKLLDFGLARFSDDPVPPPATSTTDYANTRLTQSGVTLGTWQYMSPEQVRGQQADRRSDVFALGAVMYEMFTGRRAFEAANHHDLVTAILNIDSPALTATDPAISAALDSVVRTCLAKNPDDRWQSGGDVRRALSTAAAVVPGASIERRSLARQVAAIASVGIVALAVAVALWPRSPRSAARIVRAALTLPPGVAAVVDYGAVAFAPDGASIVYVGMKDGQQQLYLRRLHESVDTPIPGTENASMPFFSPDGQWLGYGAPGYLKRVPIAGGRPVIICNIQSYFGASWGEDGTIVFSHRPESGVFRVAASGGTPEELTQLAPEDQGNDHRYPQILPGGHAMLYSVATGPEDSARVVALDLQTGTRKDIVIGAAAGRFVPPDQLVYARGGELFAVPFSVERLETTGPARLIATGVAEETDGAPEYSFSGAGDLVHVPGRAGGARHRLTFVDLQGRLSPISVPPMDFHRPRVSPDGRLIAFYVGAAKNNVWAFDRDRDSAVRVTFGRFHEPVWIPDGRLAMAEGGPGAKRLATRSVDGTGGSTALTEKAPDHFPEAWSPDGRTLVYRVMQPEGHWDLWSLSAADKKRQPLLASPFDEMNARFSPDGRWIAYSSNETGRPEIFVRTLAENSGRWPVSTGGGFFVAWAPDGRRLYYTAPDGMWAVDVLDGGSFSVGRPRRLFSSSGFLLDFDITPDGRQFVMIQLDTMPAPTQLHLAMNLLAPSRD